MVGLIVMHNELKNRIKEDKLSTQEMGPGPQQRVLKRRKMAKKYFKNCPPFLAIREMQTKTLRFYLTPVRMAKISKTTDNSPWSGYGEKTILIHCWWDCKLVQSL